jgi:hypothetical protein
LKCVPIYGGTDYRYQFEQLNNKVDVICATPGRLKDLMEKRNFVNKKINFDFCNMTLFEFLLLTKQGHRPFGDYLFG